MATDKRTFPNSYFTWYNDDNRVAILTQDTTATSAERTKEKYDTFQGDGNLSGTITASTTSSTVTFTSASHGLIVGDRVAISGTTSYNNNYTITAKNTNDFSISASNSGDNETGTWKSLFIDNGLRITYHSKYSTIDAQSDDLKTDAGLDSGMHVSVLCYIKARLFEDSGDLQRAQYFRKMYEKMMKQYPLRKTGVRQLSVPKM